MARLGRNAGAHFVCVGVTYQRHICWDNYLCCFVDCNAESLSRVDKIKLERTVILNGANE